MNQAALVGSRSPSAGSASSMSAGSEVADDPIAHVARCTMIGPVAAEVPQAERTSVARGVIRAVVLPGRGVRVLITVMWARRPET